MKAHVLVAVLAVAGDAIAGPPPAPVTTDALWKLEPAHAEFGLVVSPNGVAMVVRAVQQLMATETALPELATFARGLADGTREVTGGATFELPPGVSADGGFARFLTSDGNDVFAMSVIDRDKFVAAKHGTRGDKLDRLPRHVCKPFKGFYACADTEAGIDALGTGDGHLHKAVPVNGDVEMVGANASIAGMHLNLVIVGSVKPGMVIVHGGVVGLPAQITSQLPAPQKPHLDSDTTGFAVGIDAGELSRILADAASGNAALAGVATALTAPVTLSTHPSRTSFDVRLPMTNATAAAKLVAHCADPTLASLGFSISGGTCHWLLPNSAVDFDVWGDGTTLRFGDMRAANGPPIELTSLGKDLADGTWNIALWGRGTVYQSSAVPVLFKVPTADWIGDVRMMSLLSELGFGARFESGAVVFVLGVRTLWANPDDVIAKLVAIPGASVIDGSAGAAAQNIAHDARKSLFAGDLQTGVSGLMLPVFVLRTLTVMAGPAIEGFARAHGARAPTP